MYTGLPRCLFLTGDETGSALWRVWSVCAALQERGYVAEWCHKDEADKVLPLIARGTFDLVITPRIVWPDEGVGERWINAIHGAGLAWVYECDDDVWLPGIVRRQSRNFASEASKGREVLEWERQQRIKLIDRADGVTVSTRRLKTIVEMHTDKPVMVVPNAIDVQWFRRTLRGVGRIPELVGKLTVGWAGGARDDIDLAPLADAWQMLAEKYPDLHFVVQGHISKRVTDRVPADRLHTLPWLPLTEYPRALVNFDIGCCNVAPLLFNPSKSCIKWYEMTVAGVPCVVSDTLYGREVTDGQDGLVADDTPEKWFAQLERLVVDAELRKRIARGARFTVVNRYSLARNINNWPAAWAEILADFHQRRQGALILPTGSRGA